MMLKSWVIQSISVSFQLAGALVLLLYNVSTKRDDIIRSMYNAMAYTERNGNTQEINDLSIQFREKYRNAYLNKAAFFLLTVGYVLSLFGAIGKDEQCSAFFLVIVLTTLFVWLTKFLVEKYCLQQPDASTPVRNADLERLGIEPHSESLSDIEVNDIWESTLPRQ